MDVSADLTELGRTPIAVVCAGVKSILDIPRTLEVRSPTCLCATGLQQARSQLLSSSGVLVLFILGERRANLHSALHRLLAMPCISGSTAVRLYGQVLETMGVCVSAYGADEFPAFFSARSGCAAPARVDRPRQAAALVRSVQQLDLGSGVVVGQPCSPLAVYLHPSR